MQLQLYNESYLKSLSQKYGLVPSKKYGQNFLLQPEVIAAMVEAGEVAKDDMVVEVGPGFGVLTLALAEKAKTEAERERQRQQDIDLAAVVRGLAVNRPEFALEQLKAAAAALGYEIRKARKAG